MTLVRRFHHPLYSLFDNVFSDGSEQVYGSLNRNDLPAVNIQESDDSFLVALKAPGLKKSDFKIKLEKDQLTIFSEIEETKEETSPKYIRREFQSRSFTRSFTLPENIEADGISANYEDGILTVGLPKKEPAPEEGVKEITVS